MNLRYTTAQLRFLFHLGQLVHQEHELTIAGAGDKLELGGSVGGSVYAAGVTLTLEPEAVIRAWYDQGWLVTDANRKQKRLRLDGERPWTYAISRMAVAMTSSVTLLVRKPRVSVTRPVSRQTAASRLIALTARLAEACHAGRPI